MVDFCCCIGIRSMQLEKEATSLFVSPTVLTGKVTSVTPRSQGSAAVEVSVIKVFKGGRLQFRKRGPTTSATLTATCMKCPALRKGVNYVLMGQVNDEGLGVLTPSSFALQHKTVHDKALANLAKKTC